MQKKFRDNTNFKRNKMGFYFNSGGMGDYLNYLSAIYYALENYPFNDYVLVVPEYLVELCRNALRKFPDLQILPHSQSLVLESCLDVRRVKEETINATVTHLMDLGFIYYARTNPVPEGYKYYLDLDLSDVKLHGSLKGKDYAVMTPCFTADSRHMKAETFNKIKNYIIDLGLKPVFLGNQKMKDISSGDGYVRSDKKISLRGGLNLINKTSVLEAAKVIENSKFIVGLDNGLLHLGAMTKAPVVFGYTIASPIQRHPSRKHGSEVIDVVVSEDELACIHCQDKFRFLDSHQFRNCLYNDFKCLDLLNFEKFKAGIDRVYSPDFNLDL